MPEPRGRPPDRKPKAQRTAIQSALKEQPKLSSPHPIEQHTPAAASAGRSLRTLRGMIGQILVWASVLMTLVAGAFYFLPRITVEPSGPYDPKSPSSITFTVGNANIVPIRDVQPEIGVCYINVTGQRDCNGPAESMLAFEPWFVKWLDVDEKYQIAIEDFIPGLQIESANITIAIEYTPWCMPWFWRNTKQFRFIAKKLRDGRLYWTPTPLNR